MEADKHVFRHTKALLNRADVLKGEAIARLVGLYSGSCFWCRRHDSKNSSADGWYNLVNRYEDVVLPGSVGADQARDL
jgi:hypothetical protein